MDLKALIRKYSVSGPRYTSYPTVPSWTEEWNEAAYRQTLTTEMADAAKPLALYVHIPFCEELCYYCGCNIQITKDHRKGGTYVDTLLRELGAVAALIPHRRKLAQISWGGGTPTFLSVSEMTRLHEGTLRLFDVASDAEVSIEIDPRVTTDEHLKGLRGLGFNRVSLGVQDFDPKVQESIHRIQSREMTEAMLERARVLGFKGINFDLIYGLPYQTIASFEKTIAAVMEIKPDRIALYNYAHLPSLIKHQRILDLLPMPSADERVEIFSQAFGYLTRGGYQAIGMDHFALKEDELYQAILAGSLYRNFMGYTVKKGTDMIGIGVSAIGEFGSAYYQNVKEARAYEERVTDSGLATLRGCRLTSEDLRRKWVIQSLMCRFELVAERYAEAFKESLEQHFGSELAALAPFFDDGILESKKGAINVTPLGRLFIRNVAMVFDAYVKAPHKASYSKTV